MNSDCLGCLKLNEIILERERLLNIISQLSDPRNCGSMISAIGMLPINSAGMRKAVDEIDRLLTENQELKNKLNKNKNEEKYFAIVDYGTVSTFYASVWRNDSGIKSKFSEYFYNSRKAKNLLTDEDYYEKLKNLIGSCPVTTIYIDPSAASFIQCVNCHDEFFVVPQNIKKYINSSRIDENNLL